MKVYLLFQVFNSKILTKRKMFQNYFPFSKNVSKIRYTGFSYLIEIQNV